MEKMRWDPLRSKEPLAALAALACVVALLAAAAKEINPFFMTNISDSLMLEIEGGNLVCAKIGGKAMRKAENPLGRLIKIFGRPRSPIQRGISVKKFASGNWIIGFYSQSVAPGIYAKLPPSHGLKGSCLGMRSRRNS